MCVQMIIVSSITYAIRGRDLLRSKGYKVSIERLEAGPNRPGCGYAICVLGDISIAAQILQSSGVKVLDIVYGG